MTCNLNDQVADCPWCDEYAPTSGQAHTLSDQIAESVTRKLSGSVISSVIPAEIGKWIAESVKHSQLYWTYTVPMVGAEAMILQIILNPDGTMQQEFRDCNNRVFWRGTFRPAGDAA